jgi:hypothetical protein
MTCEPAGMRLAPTLPAAWGPVTLTGIPYRHMMLDLHLDGQGTRVTRVLLDGTPIKDSFVSCDLRGPHRVDITLADLALDTDGSRRVGGVPLH